MNYIKSDKNSLDNLEYVEPEIWKGIEGYEGLYDISNYGNIRSYKNNKWGLKEKPSTLKPQTGKYGEKSIVLHRNDNGRRFIIHRLVAETFIDNPEGKPCVNHLDGDRSNNHVDNLEWCTYSENMVHSYANGLHEWSEESRNKASKSKRGENNSTAKLTKDDVIEIRNTYKMGCFSQREIAKAWNVTHGTIGAILREETWKHV